MTSADASPRTAKPAQRVPLSASALGLAAIYAAAFWLLVVLAFHAIRPELELCCSYVSSYGRGEYDWLMQAAFVVFGFGWLAAGLSLRRALRGSRGAATLRTMLFVVGFALIVAGMWQIDEVGSTGGRSPENIVHTAGSLVAFVGLAVFGVVAAWVLRGSRLSGLAMAHLVLGLVTAALVLMFWYWDDAVGDGSGYWQRALTMIVMPGWLAWLGWRLVLTARAR